MFEKLESILKTVPNLSDIQRDAMIHRYTDVLSELKRKRHTVSLQYHTHRITNTVGSLAIPALLSIQYTENNGPGSNTTLFWITWAISFIVTLTNGLYTMFKIDKRYVTIHTAYEQLHSEGWQFIQLGGRYSYGKESPTHCSQLLHFIHAIEKLKMRVVEDEYTRIHDSESQQPRHLTTESKPTSTGPSPSNLAPPSPITASKRNRYSRRKRRGLLQPTRFQEDTENELGTATIFDDTGDVSVIEIIKNEVDE
jgi:hypothetical protein